MQRKFIIKIYKDYDWEIKIKTLSDYALYPEMGLNVFTIARQTDDKKIVYLFDADIEESNITAAKQDTRFNEFCKFEYIYNDGDEEKEAKHFEGTFIDALTLIKKEFNNEC